MNASDNLSFTKITLVPWMSESWTQRDGIAMVEGLDVFRLGTVITGRKMNASDNLSFTKITLVPWMSESWTQRDGIAMVEGLCDVGGGGGIILAGCLHVSWRRAISLFCYTLAVARAFMVFLAVGVVNLYCEAISPLTFRSDLEVAWVPQRQITNRNRLTDLGVT
jgi:hypothetical protein